MHPWRPEMVLLENIAAFLRRWRNSQRGSYTIIFALSLVPMLIAIGATMDYSLAYRAKERLSDAADAAALAAVDYQTTLPAASVAQATANNMFAGDIARYTDIKNTTVTTTITDTSAGRTAVVNYSGKISTVMLGIIGQTTLTLSGSSTAGAGVPVYMDFYLLLDNTPSMGIGATTTDIATMVNNTPDQCAFACHDLSNSNNYYNLAKSLGVTMRIDVVRTATQQLMTTATSTETVSNQFRMAIYTFGSSDTNVGLTAISSLTSNLANASSAASGIDLMTTSYQNYNNDQDTPFDSIMTQMNSVIPTPGTGASSSSPQKVLFLVTDGVADEYLPYSCTQPTTGGRCQEPLTTSLCTTMKNRGIKIAVLYTTYQPLPTNSWYNTWIGPFQPNLSTIMQSCATTGLFFAVSPTQGISTAMNALFQKALGTAHLTQ